MRWKMINNYRQGDVIILGINAPKKKIKNALDNGYKPKGDNIIIEGEMTGHFHKCENGKLYEKGDKLIIEAEKGCILTHPEHASIPLPKGTYEINIQVEYDETKPDMKNKVKD